MVRSLVRIFPVTGSFILRAYLSPSEHGTEKDIVFSAKTEAGFEIAFARESTASNPQKSLGFRSLSKLPSENLERHPGNQFVLH